MTTRARDLYDIDADLGEHVTHPDQYDGWAPRNRFSGDWAAIGAVVVVLALMVTWLVVR